MPRRGVTGCQAVSLVIVAFAVLRTTLAAESQRAAELHSGRDSEHVRLITASAAQLQQISAGQGWVLIYEDVGSSWENHLYWTRNNGSQWSDITPPLTEEEYIDSATFLDESHGWVCITAGAGDWNGARLAIRRGNRWLTAPLDNSYFVKGFDAPFNVQFVDAQHGWIVIYSPTSQAVEPGPDELAVTNDGGLTWKRLPRTPVAGGVLFIDSRDGLLVSDSPDRKIALWVTHDAGGSWKRHKRMAMPRGFEDWNLPMGEARAMPHFEDKQHGVWFVGYEPPEREDWKGLDVKYETLDGGDTWQIKETYLDDRTHKKLFGPRTLAGSHVIQVHIDTSGQVSLFPSYDHATARMVVSLDGVEYSSSNLPSDLRGLPTQVSFGDQSHGWIAVQVQRCTEWCGGSPESALMMDKSNGRSCSFDCLQFTRNVEVLSTSDGGHTFTVVTPAPGFQRP